MGRKPNYGYEKRQKEIAKKAKKDEKKKRRLAEAEDGKPADVEGEENSTDELQP
mgnify:CR=1 FL=1